MAHIYTSVEQLIGHTPLMELCKIEQSENLRARILVKLERFNPAGSAKDRVALSMLDDAEARGLLAPGGTVIEPTSGNTGIGLACVGAARGYRVVIVMPDSMSVERQQLMKAYGAELVLTPGAQGMAGAIAKAEQLHSEIEGSIVAGQFVNPANAAAHYNTTGPEIWQDTDGAVDYFVAGVGTGGTITGTAEYLKAQKPAVRVVAVEPINSAVLSGGKPGAHDLQGIGGGFIPEVLNTEIYDEIITISDEAAYEGGRRLAQKEGLLVGITSGAALAAALEIAKRPEAEGKTVVVLLPDTGERYLSTKMFN